MSSADNRLQRAITALEGLAVGDALGGFFEFAGKTARRRITERWLPAAPWHWTDDTQMAGAVVATLQQAWLQSREPLPYWPFVDNETC